MLLQGVVGLALPLHGVELAGLLFADYIHSSLFHMDVAEALCDVSGWFSFFRSGFKPSALFSFYSRLLTERMLYRLLECGVSAACLCSGSEVCKDAIAFHCIFPIVRDYRHGRFWLTRGLRCVRRALTPGFLKRGGGGGGSVGSGPGAVESRKPSSREGAVKLFPRGEDGSAEANFYRSPPRPSHTEPFANMPESCRDALQYYVYSYQTRPYYTVFVSGLISDLALFAEEQIIWASYFYQERQKPTSRWRMWKPYLGDLAVVATQSCLVYAARVVGIALGQRLSQEPTGGGVFWGEHLTLLLCTPAIHYVSMTVGLLLRAALEQRHPRTEEDEREDSRVEEEAEEAARAQAAAARAAFAFTAGPGGSEDSSRHTAGTPHARSGSSSGGGVSAGAGRGISYYAVLGVSEQAKTPEIKKAYRALALQNHPDRVRKEAAAQQQAREQMSILNEAYDTLVDADKRSQYDAARRFSDGSDFFKRLESMSVVQLTAVSTGAILGLGALAVVSVYGQYLVIFHRVTSLGRSPLQPFS